MDKFDLERRTKMFALNVRSFVRRLQRMYLNVSDIKQVIRSSGSVAANYIEGNNSLSRADFLNRIKICRKEARETVLWLELLSPDVQTSLCVEHKQLLQEAQDLVLIFAAILRTAGAIK